MFMGYKINLEILDMEEFDMFPYHFVLDCYAKTVTVVMPEMEIFERDYTFKPTPIRIVSAIHAHKLVKKGVV